MARCKITRVVMDEGYEPVYLMTIYPENSNEVWSFDVRPCRNIDEISIRAALESCERALDKGETP